MSATAKPGTDQVKDSVKPKKKFRKPSEFKGNAWAENINSAVDSLDPTDATPAKSVGLGESYCATAATMLQIEGEVHPGWIALANTGMVAGVIAVHMLVAQDKPSKGKGKKEGLGLAARLQR